jgi:hypothetical protein
MDCNNESHASVDGEAEILIVFPILKNVSLIVTTTESFCTGGPKPNLVVVPPLQWLTLLATLKTHHCYALKMRPRPDQSYSGSSLSPSHQHCHVVHATLPLGLLGHCRHRVETIDHSHHHIRASWLQIFVSLVQFTKSSHARSATSLCTDYPETMTSM